MSLHKASLDGIVPLGDVEDKSDLINPELEQIVIDISESIGSFVSDLIQVGGTILEGTVGDKADWSQQKTRFVDLIMR